MKEVTVMLSVTSWLWRLASCRTDIVHVLQPLSPHFPSTPSRCMAKMRSQLMCLWNKLDFLLEAVMGGVKATKGWKKLTTYFIFFTNHFTLTTIRRKYAAVNSVSWSSFVLSTYQRILNVLDLLYIWTYLSKILTGSIQKALNSSL